MRLFRTIYETSPQKVYRYFADKRRQRNARDVIVKYISTFDVRKLQLGCGGNILDTWLNSDLVPDNKDIVMLDAGKTFPIPSTSFDYIYSEHIFEHLNFSQQVNFLTESLRILKPGGKIRIATPDFDFLAQLAANQYSQFEADYLKWNFQSFLKYVPTQLMDVENINVYVVNNYFRDWGHQFIHNKSSIKKLMQFYGFKILGFEKVGQSNDPVFTGLERHGKMITEAYNEYETMIVEAVRPEKKKSGDEA